MKLSEERGTGRTTEQMKNAKIGALFISLDGIGFYLRELAKKLGREDLIFKSPQVLTFGRLQGHRYPEIVLDHAVNLNDKQYAELDHARIYAR